MGTENWAGGSAIGDYGDAMSGLAEFWSSSPCSFFCSPLLILSSPPIMAYRLTSCRLSRPESKHQHYSKGISMLQRHKQTSLLPPIHLERRNEWHFILGVCPPPSQTNQLHFQPLLPRSSFPSFPLKSDVPDNGLGQTDKPTTKAKVSTNPARK